MDLAAERRTLGGLLEARGVSRGRRWLLAGLSLAIAAGIWMPSTHRVFRPDLEGWLGGGIAPRARALAARHLELWTDPALREREVARMRVSNAEWDFMGRTFLVLALANMALHEPSRAKEYLAPMDRIIDETLALESSRGLYFFLMDYARSAPFVRRPARSLFVDGEIALMLASRRMVEEKDAYRALLRERATVILESLEAGPFLCAESYPDECWMFCNAAALAALKLQDSLDGTDHGTFFRKWLDLAGSRLVDPRTGILVSSFSLDGGVRDGPEGSTIWTVCHFLSLVAPAFAEDQYRRARKELGRDVLGFGYALEWPRSWTGPMDVDSGPIVPLVGASAGSSGQALLGAATFGDREYLSALLTTLGFAAMPVESRGALRFCASNQVGDAVMLYALVQGPLWRKAAEVRRP
ncbi:MAG: hypothetical protein HY721_07335 [Planctomycetes bacterium]|nr:hypothetical protein [Planctomycetota bacterium]